MNKFTGLLLQNYLEERGQYLKLLRERFLDQRIATKNLINIKEGFKLLGLNVEIFEKIKSENFIIYLGGPITRYEGYELPLYIGHKKCGLPIPAGLTEKLPGEVINLIEKTKGYRTLAELTNSLKSFSLSPSIFLTIHNALLNARVETFLPNLLGDVEKLIFKNLTEAMAKIPEVYFLHLSPPSLTKLLKKIFSLLQSEKERMTEELRMIDMYSQRLKEQLPNLYTEFNTGLKEILENYVEKGESVESITRRTSNLFSRIERLFLGNVYHLKDYERRKKEIQQILRQEEDFKFNIDKKLSDKRRATIELFEEYLFFSRFGDLTPAEEKLFFRTLIPAFEEMHRQKSIDLPLLGKFEKKSLLGVELDFPALKEAYHSFMRQILIPDCLGQCLFDLVLCLPPRRNEPKRVVIDLANFTHLALEGNEILCVKKPADDYPADLVNFIESLRKCITVLVYDIRGSSYMGIKLHNALKEQRIKCKFAREMAEVAKRYGGFLLKDTGDGGIIWFGENSDSLYNHLYTESITGKGTNLRYSIFSGADFELIPAPDSAKRASLCARDMVIKAEEFIKANFMHYREWFVDVTERTMEVDGVTYALLPPEFRSLFRIGIGIASGLPERDVVIGANSFGDPDLVGPILADAHLYSMERQPGRSVIICDLPTFVNLMLNIESFEFPLEEEDFEKYMKLLTELRKTVHGYVFPDYKISIAPRGVHILEELDKRKALVDSKVINFMIDELGNLYNEEKKKIKPIYEIITMQ
ncbi:MAG: hypothetical protein ABIL70_06930 [candidate division WOR-3 bacterium]